MAVHVLAVLAYKQGDPVTSEFLAASVNTHPVVIRRLLLALQEGKLVKTRKGSGSQLARPPLKISMAEVYRAVEMGEAFRLPPRKPKADCPVGQCIKNVLESVFVAAQTALEKELEKTTLNDLLKRIHASCGRAGESNLKPE